MVRPKLDFILKSQQASGRFTSESDESLIRESDRELMMDAHLATRGIEDRRVLQAMAQVPREESVCESHEKLPYGSDECSGDMIGPIAAGFASG